MAKIFSDITELIGNTPLMELRGILSDAPADCRLLAKLERANPGGSAKDRVALQMIRTAEAEGRLVPGGTIIEPTSGNTGVGLAAVAAVLGYKTLIVMPDSMSPERRALIAAYGAELVLTPGSEGMTGAIRKAEELHAALPGSIIAGQFENPANAEAHYRTTGPEIWADTKGEVDIFVAGVGTGGTITGTGRYLKEKNPALRVVAVEPSDSPVLSGGKAGSHPLQGIGAGFIPAVLDTGIYDEVIPVSGEDALRCMRELARRDGLLCGISGGAAAAAAVQLARREENRGKTIVVLLPDTGERYLSIFRAEA